MINMTKTAFCLTLVLLSASFASSQSEAAGSRFPGLSPDQLKKLESAKKFTAIPLPTWLPAGFKAEKVLVKLGPRVPLEDKQLVVIYSKRLANGKKHQISIEGGFDGMGGLPYEVTKIVSTPVGKIDLMYQPEDEGGDGNKLNRFSMSEWFTVGKTAFHFNGMHGTDPEDDPAIAMISLADTERILRSLRRF